MAVNSTVLGLPIKVSEDLRTPLGAVVIVKGLDSDGDVCHWIHKTDDVTSVEAVGMLVVAGDEFRAGLADLIRKCDDP